MTRGVCAKRYAQAVFDIAREKNELDRWHSDLEKVARLGTDAVLAAFWENPKRSFEEKVKLLSAHLGDINPPVVNLACLLIAGGRFGIIGDIAGEYRRLLDAYHGIERAEITTAVPLDDDQKLKLSEHLSSIAGRKVVLETGVDPGAIGGIVIRMGGKLLDASVVSRLESLKRGIVGIK